MTGAPADYEGDDVRQVVVRDDGPGIPPEEVVPLDAGTESELRHGRGLALWQLQWGVEKLGGDLSFPTAEAATLRLAIPDLRADSQ